jgi:hypothetical protein
MLKKVPTNIDAKRSFWLLLLCAKVFGSNFSWVTFSNFFYRFKTRNKFCVVWFPGLPGLLKTHFGSILALFLTMLNQQRSLGTLGAQNLKLLEMYLRILFCFHFRARNLLFNITCQIMVPFSESFFTCKNFHRIKSFTICSQHIYKSTYYKERMIQTMI